MNNNFQDSNNGPAVSNLRSWIRISIFLFITLIISTSIQAQIQKPKFGKKYTETPYKTYSRISDLRFPQMVNYKDTVAHLSDFKEKLVILDFWGTYCDPCFKTFPLEDSLQREYGDKLQIILANCNGTRNAKKSAITFLNRWAANHSRPLSMPVSNIQEEFAQQFSVMVTPTFIWIGPNGKVLGSTTAEFMTRQNLEHILQQIALQKAKEDKSNALESNLKNIKK